MARKIIGLAMHGDVEYEIASKALAGFKRALCGDGQLYDAFYGALDDWREGMGLKLDREVSHDDLRLSITLPAAEYAQWCREVSTAWRKRLADSNEVLDIAEAVNKGINTALTFIGLKVEQQPEPKRSDTGKAATPRGRFAAAVPNLKAAVRKSARKAKPAGKAQASASGLKGKIHVNGLANGAAAHV